jgi:hypothetical protein
VEIPWTPLSKPLADSTVALLSSVGLALKTDRPFDQEGERRNPWWGDPSYRILPRRGDLERAVRLARTLTQCTPPERRRGAPGPQAWNLTQTVGRQVRTQSPSRK